jgi:hypothetical protein
VSVRGENELLDLLREHYFVVNGHVFEQVVGQQTISSVGEILQVDYYATLNADFTKYADGAGNIEISVLGLMEAVGRFTPVYMTNSINIKIKPPMPWLDSLSAAVSTFDDLSDHNLTSKHVSEMKYYLKDEENGLARWVLDLSERANFNRRMDVFSAHRVVLGEFHESFFDYKSDFDTNVALSLIVTDDETWLRIYADMLLSSIEYRARFDPIPFLVGSYANSDKYDYALNRRKFVHQILQNKYEGYSPRFEQLHEGASRILQFWATVESQSRGFQNGYWETDGPSQAQMNPNTNQIQQDFLTEPPRRDSFYGFPIYPTNQGLPIQGECAIEFVFNMTRETKLNGMDYVSYTEQYRDTMFKKGTLLVMLWREKAFPMSYARLSAMPINMMDFINHIIDHPNFFAKYNFIWQDSPPLKINNTHWKSE